jgi:DNA modification methylase
MTPYYEQSGVTIYHGDCTEVIGQWEGIRTQTFDLLLTDPPYGVLADAGSAATRRSGGNKDDGRIAWDVAPSAETLARLMAISSTQMIWGGWHLSLPPTFGYLVWDKQIDGLNFGECEVCWTPQRFAPRIFRYRAVGVDGGKLHPTQKPEALMRWCISRANNPRTVLDPFMGSGTTLVAAKRLGLTAVGIEREEKYCEIAARRLQQEALPLEVA